MTDEELDRAIDHVARDMMSTDAPIGLRIQVLEQLTRGDQPPRVGIPRWVWATVPTFAVALLVGIWATVAVGPVRPAGPAPNPVVAVGTAPALPASPATAAVLAFGVAAIEPAAAASRRTRRQAAPERPKPGLAWDAGPEPLAMPEPIAIAALGPAALEIPALHVAPLTDIQPLTIAATGTDQIDPQRREKR